MSLLVSLFDGIFGYHRKYNSNTEQIAYDCPACSNDDGLSEGDGKGNLEINFNKNVFRCWKCSDTNNMKGTIPFLIKKYGTKQDLIKYNLLKPEYIEYSDENKVNSHLEAIKLPDEYISLTNVKKTSYKSNLALTYLKKRGINQEIIDRFNIGYAYSGEYFNRIIIPSYDANNQLNYFVGRWFDERKNKLKYLNPEIEKQLIIFNERYLNMDASIYIVEGVTDHIVTPNSIPLLGKSISPLLLQRLHDEFRGLYIVILLDDDAYKDAIRLYEELNFGNLRNKIRLCTPPRGYDPSKIYEKMGNRGVIQLLRTSYKPLEKHLYVA